MSSPGPRYIIGAGHGRPLSWITYAGAYYVAYLLKIVSGGAPLPHDVAGFVGGMQYYLGLTGLRRCHDGGRLPGHAGGAGLHRR